MSASPFERVIRVIIDEHVSCGPRINTQLIITEVDTPLTPHRVIFPLPAGTCVCPATDVCGAVRGAGLHAARRCQPRAEPRMSSAYGVADDWKTVLPDRRR